MELALGRICRGFAARRAGTPAPLKFTRGSKIHSPGPLADRFERDGFAAFRRHDDLHRDGLAFGQIRQPGRL
jgi:hypothetical protein